MNPKDQEKNTLLYLIRQEAENRGWGPTDLDKYAGLAPGKGSQLISGKKRKTGEITPLVNFGIENIFKVLKALDLVKLPMDENNEQKSKICHICHSRPFKNESLSQQIRDVLLRIEEISPEVLEDILFELKRDLKRLERMYDVKKKPQPIAKNRGGGGGN